MLTWFFPKKIDFKISNMPTRKFIKNLSENPTKNWLKGEGDV